MRTPCKLRNLDHFVDRHGKDRWYYREGKGPRIPLPRHFGSDAFMKAYDAAAEEMLRRRTAAAAHENKAADIAFSLRPLF